MTSYYVHPTAIVEEGAVIGEGTRIWHFAHIRKGARIGARCNIGKDVYIDENVVIGNGVKIQNGVSVYRGVTLEDNVFVGPYAVFTNEQLAAIAQQRPQSRTALQTIDGIGAAKSEKYGAEFLAVVAGPAAS